MKASSFVFAALLAATTSGSSEDVESSVVSTEAEASITGSISDGTPAPPAPEPEPIPFEVESSVNKTVYVVESPESPGLPAPEGDINVTVQRVKDPGLPDPVAPMPALSPDDPEVLARIQEQTTHYRETQLVFVSATVYDHSRTFLRCYPSGNGHKEAVCAWSNIDFNHFSGFSTYQVKGDDGEIRQYGLLMGLGNQDTAKMAVWLAKHDREDEIPEIPELPDLATGGPAYKIVEGESPDETGVELIDDMHVLYKVEGTRMEEAYQARIKAYEERKAYLLANPPKPEDVTIRFWKRERPVAKKEEGDE